MLDPVAVLVAAPLAGVIVTDGIAADGGSTASTATSVQLIVDPLPPKDLTGCGVDVLCTTTGNSVNVLTISGIDVVVPPAPIATNLLPFCPRSLAVVPSASAGPTTRKVRCARSPAERGRVIALGPAVGSFGSPVGSKVPRLLSSVAGLMTGLPSSPPIPV